MPEWIHRLRQLFKRNRFESDLEEEIHLHVECRAAELQASGVSPREAREQAKREFGSVALAREESRAAWRFGWLEDLAADLRQALRGFRRNPAFTLTSVVSLALGIGGATAIYTAVDAIFWKTLPVADPKTLVTLIISRGKEPPETDVPAEFLNRLRRSDVFAGIAATNADGLSFTYDGRAERIVGEMASPDYFETLGVQPLLGEAFSPAVRHGHWAAEAVLSYNFWKRRFAGDPAVIGRVIHLNTYPFTIVGVSPPSFTGLARGVDNELRIPLLPRGQELAQIQNISGSPDRWLFATARLKSGVTREHAQAVADSQFQDFLRITSNREFKEAALAHLLVVPSGRGYWAEEYVHPFRTPLYLLLALVAVVLLIVCSNIANMLLARGAARAREFAIRTSIGAGRFRLIRQMLTESVLLALIGGALGLALAYWLTDVLFHFLPQGHINIVVDLHPDTRALLFAFAASLLTGVAFGLAPSLQITRGNLAGTLKNDSNASIGASRGARFRKMLVIAQVAFSLVLLIAAAVFVRTLSELRPSEYRSHPDRVLLFTLKPQRELYSENRKRQLAAELVRRMSALPGVRSAALAEYGPLGSRTDDTTVEMPGQAPFRVADDWVTPGLFDTVGIARLAGRDFDARDRAGSPQVVVINQTLARALFPNQNPIGRTLRTTMRDAPGNSEIIGVVADAHYYDVHKPPPPCVWFSMLQIAPYMPTLHVRSDSPDTAGMIAAVRREFDVVDKGFRCSTSKPWICASKIR